uniref:Peptidase S1 domain-containing protein n=1 Tax=Prolemur simus TaxID=1328070 RepID=A0A8C9DKE5_PROSS
MWFLVLCLTLSLGRIGAAPAIQSWVVGGWECENNIVCGDALVHPQWVLTATHCFSNGSQASPLLPRHSLFSHSPDPCQFVHVSKSFPHPQFNISLLKNYTHQDEEDYSHIMLLCLTEPAKIMDAVKVLNLPYEEPEAEMGSICFASGWGSIKPKNCICKLDLMVLAYFERQSRSCLEP